MILPSIICIPPGGMAQIMRGKSCSARGALGRPFTLRLEAAEKVTRPYPVAGLLVFSCAVSPVPRPLCLVPCASVVPPHRLAAPTRRQTNADETCEGRPVRDEALLSGLRRFAGPVRVRCPRPRPHLAQRRRAHRSVTMASSRCDDDCRVTVEPADWTVGSSAIGSWNAA